MSLIVDSQSNHPIVLNLVSSDGKKPPESIHLAPFQKGVWIDDDYKNSRDLVNGLRTKKLSINFNYAMHTKSVDEKPDVELRKPTEDKGK